MFDPNANVTAAEASKMLLTAIGYNSDVQGYTGTQWAINVTRDAQTSGFYKDVSVPANQALTRDQAAQMIWNAIQANTITKQSSVDRVDGTITDIYTATAILCCRRPLTPSPPSASCPTWAAKARASKLSIWITAL